jgi:hypothetical protein
MSGTLTIHIRIDGVRETIRAFNEMGRDANRDLRTETFKISDDLAVKLRVAAGADGNQSRLMVPTIKARKDRVPSVEAGGSKRVGRHGKPAGALIFASEFGMSSRSGWYGRRRYRGSPGRQWHPHRGAASYWFFETVEDQTDNIQRRWLAVCDRLIRKWGAGG